MAKKKFKATKQWSEKEINDLTMEMIAWFFEKDKDGNDKGHIFVDDFLLIHKKIKFQDIEFLKENFDEFKVAYEHATEIEKAKLLKYGAADRLNASIVKQHLINKHNWL